ncbi:MAG: BamA/TamA family outer membrane protein [Bacteroidota bacterium]
MESFVENRLTLHPNKDKVAMDSLKYYPTKIILAPVVIYSPETSLGGGVGAKFLFKMPNSGPETRTSNMPMSLIYTLENQITLFSGYEVFFPQEKWVLKGNLRLQNFPQLYYGIGRNTPEENEEQFSFNQVLIEPRLLKQAFFQYFFLGGGIRYNRFSEVRFEPDGLLATSTVPGARGSTSVGFELAALYDSRDNLLNAHSGWLVEFSHGIYARALGGTQDFRATRLDVRYFLEPFKNRRDVIGFHFNTQVSTGDVPLAEHPFIGSDEIMRGYREGRWIDRHVIAGQMEYRMKLGGRIGAVAFFSMGDVFDRVELFKFSNLRTTVGLGLRFLLNKEEDLNLRFDWGFGSEDNNFYLNLAEAF